MDIESDDSERWEDFFGSSTDLTPSLLGMYDSLTGSLKETLQKRQRSLPDLNEENTKEATSQHLNNEIDTVITKSSNLTESDPEQPAKKFERDTKQTRSNICILSHNVQRLLHRSESLEKIEGDAILKQQKVSFDTKPAPKFIKKNQPKLSNIPLSKNTSKLTQSVKELVETFDSSIEYSNIIDQKKYPYTLIAFDSEKIPTSSANHKYHHTPIAFDSEKTPTNAANEAFNFEIATPKKLDPVISPLLHEIEEVIEVEKVMELGALYDRDTKSEVADVIEAYNYSVGSNLNGDTSTIAADATANSISSVETLSKSVELSPMVTRKPSPRPSPLLTYARSKILAANQTSTPIASHLTRANEKSKTPKPRPSLNHRPLSSSSISSTSSSSSSGSEHIKQTTSYLASVESLADHSENEIQNGRHGTYSVFERACMEFADTETNYVEDLRQIIKGYLHNWRERKCLDPSQSSILFSNIEDIYEFNVKLLKQLIDSGKDPAKIAKCFIDLREGFDVYTTYCTSYPEAISLLTSLLQEPHTNGLLTTSQKMLQHKLPLGSYLLKPVQRILRYHLLLDNLRKHCDVKDVARAHEIMQQVAANINQVKCKLEQKSRVKELSGILDGWLGPDLTVLGDLRQEGVLMEHNKPRRVFLFGTMLIITKPKEDGRLQFKSFIYQNNLMLNEHLPGEPTSFYVIPYDEPRNQIKLTAKNREHKRFWAQEIKSVMLEKFNNIPSRAKELVFKLGEEEDRTPDTNKWKWSLNNAKPIYLERRNECRRSEIRNRSKIKRKTSVTNSTSFEGFNDTNSVLEHRPLSKNHSMDENIMSTLPRINGSSSNKQECCVNAPDCDCSSQKSSTINPALGKFNKERSRSVPRMSVVFPEADEDTMSLKENLDFLKSKSAKTSVEVKMYNNKTIPKRIANLKKNRPKKETSTFYMDLNEFEDTVLRITESTEDLSEEIEKAEEAIPEENDSKEEKEEEKDGKDVEFPTETTLREDVQIILDLLKNNKDFERIYKKPQKKKSLENGSLLNSPEPVVSNEELPPPPPPPRPPSKSPPPLGVEDPAEPSEPIYESLLRNVHVPYKFSPILNRSKSQQYYQPREKKSSPTNRPDSDYVTLVYSASGNLQKIGDELVGGFSSGPQLRSSDSKINYETTPSKETSEVRTPPDVSSLNTCQPEAIYARPVSKNLVKRLLNISKSENVSGSENSLIPRVRKSVESVSLSFGKSNKPPERRVSDVTDMCRQSYLHRQGSEAVGERIANVDYADPRTLFANFSTTYSVRSIKGDSVFSLTSSSDSGFDFVKKKRELPLNLEYLDDMSAACLEKDFRDSAIYSDDNEKRHDYSDIKTKANYHPDSPPPLPPPRKTCGISNPAVILGPAHMSSTASRSWVMKQIENFSRENQQ